MEESLEWEKRNRDERENVGLLRLMKLIRMEQVELLVNLIALKLSLNGLKWWTWKALRQIYKDNLKGYFESFLMKLGSSTLLYIIFCI